MTVEKKTNYGSISVSEEAVASLAGGVITESYGVVGMASRNQIRDNFNDILKKENFARGVVIRQEDEGVAVDVYIIVGYGTKISAICRNVQEQVKYNLETMLGFSANTVNVYVQGVKIIEA